MTKVANELLENNYRPTKSERDKELQNGAE